MTKNPLDSSPALQEQWRRFGALLRERRNAAKLSRAKLARQAKVCDTTIKFTENARHRPSRATLTCLLAVADLHLTWADVPAPYAPPVEGTDNPAALLPSPPSVLVEKKIILAALLSTSRASVDPSPDPAQFLMDLVGFDEIRLPVGTPKGLRIFQERHRAGGQAGSKIPADEPNGE